MSGDDVGTLMILLARLDFLDPEDMNTDLLFTPEVGEAVRSFETSQGLAVDGVVGPVEVIQLMRLDENR